MIEQDLDVIQNADYIIDMGPGGGSDGGKIVAAGTPEAVSANPESVTGKYLSVRLEKQMGPKADGGAARPARGTGSDENVANR